MPENNSLVGVKKMLYIVYTIRVDNGMSADCCCYFELNKAPSSPSSRLHQVWNTLCTPSRLTQGCTSSAKREKLTRKKIVNLPARPGSTSQKVNLECQSRSLCGKPMRPFVFSDPDSLKQKWPQSDPCCPLSCWSEGTGDVFPGAPSSLSMQLSSVSESCLGPQLPVLVCAPPATPQYNYDVCTKCLSQDDHHMADSGRELLTQQQFGSSQSIQEPPVLIFEMSCPWFIR